MSLYRQPGRLRAPMIAAVAAGALLVGGGIGYAIGRSSAPEPTATDAIAQLRDELRPAVNGLQLLPTEYPQAARGAGNESEAVQGALQRIDDAIASARTDLEALDPADARALEHAVAELRSAIRAKAPPARVEQLAKQASHALAQVPGGGG